MIRMVDLCHSLGFRPLAYHPIWAMVMVRNISPLEINHVLNGCSPSTRSNLTVEKTRFGATRPNQSTGIVPKNHPLSDGLHPDSQSINSPPPQYSEWDETNHGHSLSSTLNAITPSAKRARQHCQPILSGNTETSVDAKDDADGLVNPDLEPGVQRAPWAKSGASKQASRSPSPSGSDDQREPPIAKQKPGTRPKVGEISSSDEGTRPGKSQTMSGQGEL